ncbi:hypothetical protein VTK26DRAFT_3488 [Humicola hyalothermophila]
MSVHSLTSASKKITPKSGIWSVPQTRHQLCNPAFRQCILHQILLTIDIRPESIKPSQMARPKGSTGRRQLITEERIRIRALYYEGGLSQIQIRISTGFSRDQIRYTLRALDASEVPGCH